MRVSPKVRFVHSGISTNLLLPPTTKAARSFNACGLRQKHFPQFLLSRTWAICKSFLEKEFLLAIFPARACQEWYCHLPSVCESSIFTTHAEPCPDQNLQTRHRRKSGVLLELPRLYPPGSWELDHTHNHLANIAPSHPWMCIPCPRGHTFSGERLIPA